MSPIVVRFSIPGKVPSLKNRKGYDGRSRRHFDNPGVEAYKRDFAMLVPSRYRDLNLGSKEDPLEATVVVFHENWKRDVDVEIIFDCLQTAGVISNDRWIRVKHIYGQRIDPENPRADITVSYL